MSYAIRFRTRNPSDPSPAMYMSTDLAWFDPARRLYMARATSVLSDVWEGDAHSAGAIRDTWGGLHNRCERDRLIADVVPLADALRDLGDVEPRP